MKKEIKDIGTVELYLVKKKGKSRRPIEINFLDHAPNFSLIRENITDEYYFELTIEVEDQNFIIKEINSNYEELPGKKCTINIPIEIYRKGKLYMPKKMYFSSKENSTIRSCYLNSKNEVFIGKIGIATHRDAFYFIYQSTKYTFYKHGTILRCYDLEHKKQLQRIVEGHIIDDSVLPNLSEYKHILDDDLKELLINKQHHAIVKKYDFLNQQGTAYIHEGREVTFVSSECFQKNSPVFFLPFDIISFSKVDSAGLKNISLTKRIT